MDLALFLSTHGVTNRDDSDWWHQPQHVEEMRPVEAARLAEWLGFHSVWMGDHVALPESSPRSLSPVHIEGKSNPEVRKRGLSDEDVGGSKRHYPARPNILDGVAVMGAIAGATQRIKMGPSALIAPYRHPLHDARQFGTLDVLSNGRVILAAGCGWMKEEFEALGHDYFDSRMSVLSECVQIYKSAWRDGITEFHGKFFDFGPVGMFPRPVQPGGPSVLIATQGSRGARIAARHGDGVMPILTQPYVSPEDFKPLTSALAAEAERIGRNPTELAITAITSFRITDSRDVEATRSPRRILGGTAEQILEDLGRFASSGFSLLVMAPICPSRTFSEMCDQTARLGEEVLAEAETIRPTGDWRIEV